MESSVRFVSIDQTDEEYVGILPYGKAHIEK